MVKPASLLIAALLAACAPAPDDALHRLDVEIAQLQQEIRNIEADRIRYRAEREATAHQFADQPDVLRELAAVMEATDRRLDAVNQGLVADYRRSIAALEAQRRAIAGRL